jgi:hypothetical protein
LSAAAFGLMPLADCAAFTMASIGLMDAGRAVIFGTGWKNQ